MSKTYPVPENEKKRIEALRKYQILDTAPESEFDHITSLAAAICEVPMALITFVDEERQWLKAKVGVDICETDRGVAFCAHTIMNKEVLVVEDALKNPLFKDNPLVTGEPHIRFYAGAPIQNSEGMVLGSVCVVDTEPRQISEVQMKSLQDLSALTTRMLDTRLILDELASANQELKVLEGMLPICANCKAIRTDEGEWHSLEKYVKTHSEATFTHGICPCCREKLYPGF